jgi:hypothetical protein
MYRTVVRFNVVYVLESLAPGEPKTGRDLFDSAVYPGTVALEGMHAEFAPIADESALLKKLSEIAHAARVGNHRPIVHIEAHGGPDGIELADGNYIPWSRVIPALTAINEACRNNLFVVAISCQGWNLTASLMPSDRAPVFMLIGPPANMSAETLLAATRRFYDTLVATIDVNRALEAMNNHAPFADWQLRPATAEILFCRAFRLYVNEVATPLALQARENELVAKITRQRNLNVLQSAALRLQVRADLQDHRAAYDRMRGRFLMFDLFPDDVARFGLTYDLCIPGPAAHEPSRGTPNER